MNIKEPLKITANCKPQTTKPGIILIGFMGSGKSSIGKRLARHFKRDYIDTDQLIIEKIKMSISALIETEGEQKFRLLESEVLKTLLARMFHAGGDEDAAKADEARRGMQSEDACVSKHCSRKSSSLGTHSSDFPTPEVGQHEISGLGGGKFILATGGGIILDPKNQAILRQLGTIIWLHASSDTLFERAHRHSSRPLLEVENPRHTFNRLLAQRLSTYEALSHIKIDTTHSSYQQTIDMIIRKLHNISS